MLNCVGDVMKVVGVQVGYYNYQFEFFDLGDDQMGMEILFNEIDLEFVYFEFDLFWVVLIGVDIVGLFNKYLG